MQIVIVGGLPCSGKSLFAGRLRKQWPQPLLSKDEFKESLFDSLGSADRAWSRRLSRAAYDLLFQQAQELTRCRISFVIEGNFREREHRHRLEALSSPGISWLQVHCRALPEVLAKRFAERARTQARHPGHVDEEILPEIVAEMHSVQQRPLSLASEVIECDTSDDWSAAIDQAIERALAFLDR